MNGLALDSRAQEEAQAQTAIIQMLLKEKEETEKKK